MKALDKLRWNVSKNALTMGKADAFIVSFPKSGRTWLRTFIYRYYSNVTGVPFSFDPASYPGTPNVFFTHDRWQHLLLPGSFNRVRGKHLIPKKKLHSAEIALLARDPRDVVVSLYFHLIKRDRFFRFPKDMGLPEMIRHEKFGLPMIIRVMNAWADELPGLPNCQLYRYEDFIGRREEEFERLLLFIGIKQIDQQSFEEAIAFSDFDNMQKLEANNGFALEELRAANVSDVDSYKVRRGKVGGYIDAMGDNDVAYSCDVLRGLNKIYGYIDEMP